MVFLEVERQGKERSFPNTKTLLFSSVYALMTQVALRQSGSVRAAWLAAEGTTGVSPAALYAKLNALEVGTSAALVAL